MKRKKIGLTHVISEKSADFSNSYTIATLSAWIKSKHPEIDVVFSESIETLLTCDEVWATATSDAWNKINVLGKHITQADIRFLVGGHHATALPQSLKYGETFSGAIEGNTPIHKIPVPDWSIFGTAKKSIVMTSRGCPYSCNFCSSSYFWKNYMTKNIDLVIEEIKHLRNTYNSNEIVIFDDLFIANKYRLRKIIDAIIRNKLDNIHYSCLVRSDLVDQEVVDWMKMINIKAVAFGAESGSDRMLRIMNKRTTVEHNQRAIDILYSNNIKPTLSFIAGYPGEKMKDIDLTVQFIDNNRSKCDIIEIYPCVPFPGTKLWNMFCKQMNIDVNNFNWDSLIVNPENIHWDNYNMLTKEYNKSSLEELVNWNLKFRYDNIQAKRLNDEKLKRTQDVLTYNDVAVEEMSATCSLCNTKNAHLIKNFDNQFKECEKLGLYRCAGCLSLFYSPFPSANYAHSLGKVYDKFYLEFDAGYLLWASLLCSIDSNKIKSILDIGCGVGLLLDMAHRMLNIDGVFGLEPSIKTRAQLFDYCIDDGYFPDGINKNKTFDLITASEVIEHVKDPLFFLENVINSLSEHGVAILTTPNATSFDLEKENDQYAIAGPGQHTILFSEECLGNILKSFNVNFKLFVFDGISKRKQMVAFISKCRDTYDRISYNHPTSQKVQRFLVSYFTKTINDYPLQTIHAYKQEFHWYVLGVLNRLIEALVNSGDYRSCQPYMEMMINALNKFEGIHCEDMVNGKEQNFLHNDIKFDQYVENRPAYLSKFLYLHAVWLTNYKVNCELGFKFFSTAYRILKYEKAYTQFFSNDCLIESSKRHMRTYAEHMQKQIRNKENNYVQSNMYYESCNGNRKAKVMVFSFDAPSHACASIRILHPLSFLKDNLEVHWCVGHNGKSFAVNTDLIKNADMIIVQRAFPCKETLPIIQKCFNSGKPVIYELDDNLFELPRRNPNFHLSKNISYYLQLINECHAVTVSTNMLKQKLQKDSDRIYVLPNLINDNIWEFRKKNYNKKRNLTIGYTGTITHESDLRQIEKAVKQISSKYKSSVNFKFLGCATDYLADECDVDCIQFESDYISYSQNLQKLDIDLMVIPLEDNQFNRCKSNIKWLEISSCGIPAIYSDLPPYNNSVNHLQNGMLVKNSFQEWFNAMEYLIENPDIRKSMGQRAQLDVMNEYRMSRRVNIYLQALQDIGISFLGINID